MPSWLRWKKAKLKVMPSGSKVNPLVAVCNTTTPLSLLFSFFNQVERVPLLPLCVLFLLQLNTASQAQSTRSDVD